MRQQNGIPLWIVLTVASLLMFFTWDFRGTRADEREKSAVADQVKTVWKECNFNEPGIIEFDDRCVEKVTIDDRTVYIVTTPNGVAIEYR